jgi:hypothetical protein
VRGQSLAAAQQEIEAMHGVTSAKLRVVEQQSGMAAHHQLNADVVIEDEATIVNQNALVEQIVRIAWSANGTMPDQGVYLNLVTDPQVDVGGTFAEADWNPSSYTASEKSYVLVSGRAIEDHAGTWPGSVPSPRNDLIK